MTPAPRRLGPTVLSLLLLFGGVAAAEAILPQNVETTRVRAASQRWAAAWNTKDVASLLRQYAPRAIFLTSAERFAGHAAIEALLRSTLREFTPRLVLHSVDTEVTGPLAYDSGTYNETITSPTATRYLRGNYLFVLIRGGDRRWRICAQTWTEAPEEVGALPHEKEVVTPYAPTVLQVPIRWRDR